MILTPEILQERLHDAEVRFNAAKIAKDQAEVDLETKDNECLRIQGEFRAIKSLIDEQAEASAQQTARSPLQGPDPNNLPIEDAPSDSLEAERLSAKARKEASK